MFRRGSASSRRRMPNVANKLRALNVARLESRNMPPQVPNEHGHLLTTQALWGMYVEDHEPPNGPVT
jgi:hypothetical protein